MVLKEEPLIEVNNLKKYFPIQKGFLRKTVGYIKAVNGVDFNIHENETLGLVGESGCGKTTLGRTILRLSEPTEGEIIFYDGTQKIIVTDLNKEELRKIRVNMQVIFQDPFSSLNERMTVMANVGEPLYVNKIAKGRELEQKVEKILVQVGLNPEHLRRYPHTFSGGQRQRIGIARALIVNPKFVVADESVSALDVSIQAQILNLLEELREEFNLAFLFISHDLSVIRYISDRVAVMYVGRMVETAPKEELFNNPQHPYTEALLSAVPRAELGHSVNRIVLPGTPANPSQLPSGCSFHPRCKYAKKRCEEEKVQLEKVGANHYAACHFTEELKLKGISEKMEA